MKQYTIFEPVRVTRVTVVNAPDNWTLDEVYENYQNGTLLDIVESSFDTIEEELVGEPIIEENK